VQPFSFPKKGRWQNLKRQLGLFVKLLFVAVVIGAMSAVFVTSFATIIFAGKLAPFLNQGIAFALMGATLMAAIAAVTMSSRGTIVQPQDVTAILLANASAALAAKSGLTTQSTFATVVVVIGLSAIVTGVVTYVIGHMRLSFIVRFVPLQVTAGFLAASGILLVLGGFSTLGSDGSGQTVQQLLLNWSQWLPWLLLGVALAIIVRIVSSGFVIPFAFAAATAIFFAALPLFGLDLQIARELGLLLGPFEDHSFIGGFGLSILGTVAWGEIPALLPLFLAIVGLSLLGALLNAVSLELVLDREIDLNRDLKALGISNAAAGLFGGMPGYHLLGETNLARRIGIPGAAAGISVAIACALCLVLGIGLLGNLPRGLISAVVWYLGFDLILTALWDHGRRMAWRDRLLVLATPIATLAFGILPAMAFGLLAACLLFVFAYAQVDVVRFVSTAAHLKARVERGSAAREFLSAVGERTHIYKLSGFLFFGTAHRLFERLQNSLNDKMPPRVIIVDLKRLVGFDLSAWDVFERLGRRCAERSTSFILTGLSPSLRRQFRQQLSGTPNRNMWIADDLDAVLAELEEQHLQEAQFTERTETSRESLIRLVEKYGELHAFSEGQIVFREGEVSDGVMVLASGQLDITIANVAGGEVTINRLLPGALFGEVGFYSQRQRSASVVAVTDSTVLAIDARHFAELERIAPRDAIALHSAMARVLTERLISATRLLKDADI
jgi:sulfate permease, SulP family